MHSDPFERFERSRGGLLIPVAVFAVGAILTTVAIDRLNPLVTLEDLADQPRAEVDRAPVMDGAGIEQAADEKNESQPPNGGDPDVEAGSEQLGPSSENKEAESP